MLNAMFEVTKRLLQQQPAVLRFKGLLNMHKRTGRIFASALWDKQAGTELPAVHGRRFRWAF
eukprot:8680504-Lingulodinium_polyedra.AAC.1